MDILEFNKTGLLLTTDINLLSHQQELIQLNKECTQTHPLSSVRQIKMETDPSTEKRLKKL